MAKIDLKGLTKKVQDSAGSVMKGISDSAQKLPDVTKVDVAGAVKDAAVKGQAAFLAAVPGKKSEDGEKVEETSSTGLDNNGPENKENPEPELTPGKRIISPVEPDLVITCKGALQIIYCLMAIDGDVSSKESNKLREIAAEFGIYDAVLCSEIESFCEKALEEAESPEDYYDILHDKVGEVIASEKTEKGGIRGKLLLWDLYVVAYSDGEFSDTERRLARYICRTLHVDRVVALEMEQSLRTIQAIEKEEAWLEKSDREQQKVEDRIKKLAERKQCVMRGIRFLISD